VKRAAIAAVALASAFGCNAIFGITPGDPCPAARPDPCDADKLADANNCCTAGRSCQSGTCAGGECGPVSLLQLDAAEETIELLVSGDSVIWSSGKTGKLFSTPVGVGAGGRTVIAGVAGTGFQSIAALASDGAYIYFNDYLGPDIGRVPIHGSKIEVVASGDPALVAPPSNQIARVAVGGGYVYWAVPMAGILRAKAAGSAPATPETVAAAPGARAVATDQAHIYWRDPGTTSIVRLAFTDVGKGVTPTPVAQEQGEVNDLFVDADTVYWGSTTAVSMAPSDGAGGPVVILADEHDDEPFEVVSDGRDVYWTGTGYGMGQGGRVKRVAKLGKHAPTILAKNAVTFGMAGLADDCTSIYWLDSGAHGVMTATK
jgi:hypothetical protein